MKNSEMYYIKNSSIHGRGVFARKKIPAGTKILPYLGKKIRKADFERIIEERGASYEAVHATGIVYYFELDENTVIDGDIPENDARLINHSCDENCEAVAWEGEIWIVARRDISAKEELSFDYGFSLAEALDHPCRCGKSNCAKYIIRKELRWKLRRMFRK